jgi:hypothetical protein
VTRATEGQRQELRELLARINTIRRAVLGQPEQETPHHGTELEHHQPPRPRAEAPAAPRQHAADRVAETSQDKVTPDETPGVHRYVVARGESAPDLERSAEARMEDEYIPITKPRNRLEELILGRSRHSPE